MAACMCVRSPAGGSNSLPDGSVRVGRGTRAAALRHGRSQACTADSCRAKVRELRVAVLGAHVNLKIELIWKQKKNKPRFRVT